MELGVPSTLLLETLSLPFVVTHSSGSGGEIESYKTSPESFSGGEEEDVVLITSFCLLGPKHKLQSYKSSTYLGNNAQSACGYAFVAFNAH